MKISRQFSGAMKTEKLIPEPDRVPTIKYLVQHLNHYGDSVQVDSVVADVSAVKPFERRRVLEALSFMSDCGIVEIRDDGTLRKQASIFDASSERQMRTKIAFSILNYLSDQELLKDIALAIRGGLGEVSLIIDHMMIPWKHRFLRDLLLWIEIFKRDSIHQRHWSISSDYHKYFLDALISGNLEIYHQPSLSKRSLELSLGRRDELGKEAEEWAVNWEQERLSAHPLLDLICRISDENVGAGYDIVSFEGVDSYQHDRFIEVKSYSDHPSFYWSRSEIGKAKELGNKYILFLIDRDQLENPDYSPTSIRGPYSYFFNPDRPDWDYSVESTRIQKNQG